MSVKLNKKDNKFKANIIGGFCVAIVGILGALWLLIDREAISGAEFVALSLGFSVIGLIIAFAAEIQEFSIAGNGVKLKELRSEAEKKIEELDQAKIEIFRLLIQKSIWGSAHWGGGEAIVDERVNAFCSLVEIVEENYCLNFIRLDVEKALQNIINGQYNNLNVIHHQNKSYLDPLNSYDSPRYLSDKMNDKVVEEYRTPRLSTGMTMEQSRKVLNDGIEAYAKLYAIKVKLEKLETDHA